MYRIFCESYENFKNSFETPSYRLEISKPFELIVNLDKYKKEEQTKLINSFLKLAYWY